MCTLQKCYKNLETLLVSHTCITETLPTHSFRSATSYMKYHWVNKSIIVLVTKINFTEICTILKLWEQHKQQQSLKTIQLLRQCPICGLDRGVRRIVQLYQRCWPARCRVTCTNETLMSLTEVLGHGFFSALYGDDCCCSSWPCCLIRSLCLLKLVSRRRWRPPSLSPDVRSHFIMDCWTSLKLASAYRVFVRTASESSSVNCVVTICCVNITFATADTL